MLLANLALHMLDIAIPDALVPSVSSVRTFNHLLDFQSRLAGTGFRGELGSGDGSFRVAARAGKMAVSIRQAPVDGNIPQATTSAPSITVDALQALPGGGNSDGNLAVWRAP